MKCFYVYKITNTINGMLYIGSHYGKLKDSYIGSGLAISRAIEKYGKEVFKKEIIEVVDSKELLLIREAFWLTKFDCANNPAFYNLTNVAGGGFMSDGKTKEEKNIIREKQEIGRRAKRQQTVQKMLRTKQNWTEEQRNKVYKSISTSLNNLSERKKQQLAKIRAKNSKAWRASLTAEQQNILNKKNSESNKGRIITNEHKLKTSLTMKERYNSLPLDTKVKIVKHMGDIIRGKKWCNDGIRNYRLHPDKIKELNYNIGKL